MSQSYSTELSTLLEQLTAHASGIRAQEHGAVPPSPRAAMATYLVTSELVDSHLRSAAPAAPADAITADDDADGLERTLSREVLNGTRRILRAALAQLETQEAELSATPALHVVEAGTDGAAPWLRRPRRSRP